MKTSFRKSLEEGKYLLEKEYIDALDREYEESLERGEESTKLPNLGSKLTNRWFAERILSCVDFGNNDLTGAVFADCDLRGSILENAVLDDVVLIRCHIYRCSLPENSSLVKENCCESLRYSISNLEAGGKTDRIPTVKHSTRPKKHTSYEKMLVPQS